MDFMLHPVSHDPEITIVDWKGPDDPENPINWPDSRKWLITCIAVLTTFIALLNGTIITVAHYAIDDAFQVDESTFPNSYWAVTTWSMGGVFFSLIVLPAMEDFGIRRTCLLTHFIFILFLIPQALAQNYATLVATRFFAGGCALILANTAAGVIGNIWETEMKRTAPIGIWIVSYLAGSSAGPVIGASIFQFLSWRWISYMQLIWNGIFFPILCLTMKETRGTVILKTRADSIRKKGIKAYTKSELQSKHFLRDLKASLQRPLKMLITEQVVFFSVLWSAFTVGTLYIFTQSVEQVFTSLYNWDPVQAGYVQAAIVIGEVLGGPLTLLSSRLHFASARRNSETPGSPIPEARLYTSIGGSIIGMAGGMFIYAWTSYAGFPWIAPAIGLALVGAGSVVVLEGILEYIADSYAKYAGSVMADFVLGENTFSAFLPLASMRMYDRLGVHWASTLLGFIMLLLTLAPACFLIWGPQIRKRSPYIRGNLEEKS